MAAAAIVSPATSVATAASAACAVPDDCRLREAGAGAGVRIGLASPNGPPEHQAIQLAEANVVVNHELSWSGIEPERGVWDFTKADANAQFARDNGLDQLGMHFAWEQAVLDDMPGWVGDITDPDELRSVLRTRAEVLFDRYPDLDRIDVINEPFPTLGSTLYENHFFRVLGPDYIDELFAIVEAEAPPTTELMVNETGVEFQPAKADALVALIEHLVGAGHRVDAVGLQTHLSVGEPDWDLLLSTMQRLAALGVTPFISELDVPISPELPDRFAVQAGRYRRAVEVCLMVPACDMVNIWGVSDADNWYTWALEPGWDPLLWDDVYQPKPAYDAVRSALLGGRLAPRSFAAATIEPRTGGSMDVTYSMACVDDGPLEASGITLLSDVTTIFASGNPVRLTMPARLTWTPDTVAGGALRYEMEATLDLGAVAWRYRTETARPAIGLGGYLDLMDSSWLTLNASDVQLQFASPDGSAPLGVESADPDTGVALDGSGATLARPTIVGDSRVGSAPVRLAGAWSIASGPGDGAAATAVLGAPTLRMQLDVRLGVVYQGLPVDGGAAGTFTCTAVGIVPVASSTVGAGVTATAVAVPPAFTG